MMIARGHVRWMWLFTLVALGLVITAQPATAGWLSTPLQRVDHPDGSATYYWSASPPSQYQWEGRTIQYAFRLVWRSGRLYTTWSQPTLTPRMEVPTAPPPAPEAPAPVPAPSPEPAPAPPEPAPAPPEPPAEAAVPTPPAGTLSQAEQDLLDLVNHERTSRGLRPLQVDDRLAEVARLKSQDMADHNYFAHQSPTYGSPFEMMRAFGVTYRLAGENLAAAFSVESAHQALMNSPGHRANILNANYTHIGIGIVAGNGYPILATQMFVGR